MDISEILILIYADGTIGRMQFFAEPTDENIQVAIDKMGRKPTAWRRGSLEDFPLEAAFRGAWVDSDGKIVVDMSRARDIHRDRLRAARAPLLAALDIETMRVTEKADSVALAEVARKKQMLCDAPAHRAIEEAKTPDELKKLTLETLSANLVKQLHVDALNEN